jgi:arsenate reductase
MAEAWTRHLKGHVVEPYSAGLEPAGLDLLAVRVMAEAGVQLSQHRSKHLNELRHVQFDYIVTVCDQARERCPLPPAGARLLHAGFDDPPELARHARTDDERLLPYRRVRDEIRRFVERLPGALQDPGHDEPQG